VQPPRTILTGNADVDRAIAEVNKAVTAIGLVPLLDGALVENVALTTTTSKVAHKLGRRPVGYIVVRSSAGVLPFDENDGKGDLAQFLYLRSSAPVTVNLWVY
jgi:hypothetical protein